MFFFHLKAMATATTVELRPQNDDTIDHDNIGGGEYNHERIKNNFSRVILHTYSGVLFKVHTYLDGSEDKLLLVIEVRLVERILPSAVPKIEHHIPQKPACGRHARHFTNVTRRRET